MVGLQSALQQQLLQQSALEQVAREYEYATASEAASRPGCGHGYITPSLRGGDTTRRRLYQRDPNFDEDSTSRSELSTSLRTLGANMLVLARSTPMDLRTVAATPRALLHGARRLMPRLAVHASPTRLLASMVKELNETIATSVATSATLTTTHDGSSSRYLDACADALAPESGSRGAPELHLPRSDGVSVPTEEALRQHNEMQIGDAAAAAAALLARLQHEQRFDRESATSATK